MPKKGFGHHKILKTWLLCHFHFKQFLKTVDWSNFELAEILSFYSVDKDWFLTTENFKKSLQEITLDQLEELLNPKQEEPIKLDALKLIAESYGFELIKKKRGKHIGRPSLWWGRNQINGLCLYFNLKFATIWTSTLYLLIVYICWLFI